MERKQKRFVFSFRVRALRDARTNITYTFIYFIRSRNIRTYIYIYNKSPSLCFDPFVHTRAYVFG